MTPKTAVRHGGIPLLLMALGSSALPAQQAVATADVNVRSGQSTSSRILNRLHAGDTVSLVSPTKRAGYYHIQEQDGTVGWAFGRYLSVMSGAGPAPGPNSEPSSTGGAVAMRVDSNWAKPAPQTSVFHRAGYPDCGPEGQGGDTPTDLRKNRTDDPTSYHDVTFDAITGLPYPRNHKRARSSWTPAELAIIQPYEGAAVTVTAFIAQQRGLIVQDSANSRTGESTNCHSKDDAGVDWHLTLVKHPTDPKSTGIVVEVTPRVRAKGHPWTPAMLAAAITNGDSVRISGWLLYDPEHFAQTANYDPARPSSGLTVRATLWEIHPVTRFEIFDPQAGRWQPLP